MIEKLLKNSFHYWFFFILTALLCYGFALTHSSMGIDDEILGTWSNFYVLLGVNRLGLFFTRKLFMAYEYIPFVREFLFVLVYMFAINFYVKLFEDYFPQVFNEKAKIIYSCIMLAFPYTGFIFCFMDTNLEYALSVLLSVMSIYLFYSNKINNICRKYITIILLLILSISFYETGFIYFIMAVLAVSMFKIILNKYRESIWKDLYSSFSLFISSLFINWCFIFSIRKISGYHNEERIYELLKYDFSSLKFFLISVEDVISKFINNFIETCKYDAASQIVVVSCIIFFIIIIFYSIKLDKKLLLLGMGFFFMPLLPFLSTGNYEFYYRVYSPYSMFCSISFVLLYNLCRKKILLEKIYILIICYIILALSHEMNRIFYMEHLKFLDDRMFAYSLNKEVKRLGDKPLLIIGVKDNPKLNREYYLEAPEINVSIFNWDRYDSIPAELFVNRPYAFMKEQGFGVNVYKDELNINTQEDYLNFINNIAELSKDMKIYPANASVKDCGDFILIKIGKSKLNSEY